MSIDNKEKKYIFLKHYFLTRPSSTTFAYILYITNIGAFFKAERNQFYRKFLFKSNNKSYKCHILMEFVKNQ